MLPKYHILYGAIFTAVVWFFFQTISPIYLSIIFLSSFLIDFDHYISGAIKCKSLNFKKVVDYNYKFMYQQAKNVKKGIRIRENFNLFHTVEFHLFIAILGIFYLPFLYVFIGMVFHSLLDFYDIMSRKLLYSREFFFFNWVRRTLFSNK